MKYGGEEQKCEGVSKPPKNAIYTRLFKPTPKNLVWVGGCW